MKKTMGKILVLLLVCAMLAPLVACGNGNSTNSPAGSGGSSSPAGGGSSSPAGGGGESSPAGGGDSSPAGGGGESSPAGGGSDAGGGAAASGRDTITYAIDNDSGTLVPGLVTGGQYIALQSIYELLWDVDEEGNMIPVLMESYEVIAPDHLKVKLREGVLFSNGVEMTASDVVFSLNYWKTIPVNAVRVQSLDETRTAAIDKYTLDLYMLNGYYYFHDTASSMFMIHCEEGFNEDELNVHPVGTGPYVIKEYVINSHMFLERRDDYWGEPPAMKYLNFRVLAEPSQRVNALSTGLVDIALISLEDFDYVDALPQYNTVSRYIGGGVGLNFNSGVNSFFNRFTEPERKLEARFAVYHAIDPNVIINLVYQGKGRVMHNVVPDFMFDYKPEYDHMHPAYDIGYNVEHARELAQSSGLAGQKIIIMTNGLASAVLIAEIVQNMLAQIDVTLEIQNYDPATVWTMIYDPEAKYDISVGEGIAPNWRVCDVLLNGVRYSTTLTTPGAFTNNEHYLEICAGMAHEPDTAKRVAITEECLQMFVDNAIGFGLCVTQTAIAITTDIDMSSVRFSVCTGTIRLNDIKLV